MYNKKTQSGETKMENLDINQEMEETRREIWSAKKPLSIWHGIAAAVVATGIGLSICGVYAFGRAKNIETMFKNETGKGFSEVEERISQIEAEKEQLENELADTKQKYGKELVDQKQKYEQQLKGLRAKEEQGRVNGKPRIKATVIPNELIKERDKYKQETEDLQTKLESAVAEAGKLQKNYTEMEKKLQIKEKEFSNYKRTYERKLEQVIQERDKFKQERVERRSFPVVGDKIDRREKEKYNLNFDNQYFEEGYILFIPKTKDGANPNSFYVKVEKWTGNDSPVRQIISEEKVIWMHRKIQNKQ